LKLHVPNFCCFFNILLSRAIAFRKIMEVDADCENNITVEESQGDNGTRVENESINNVDHLLKLFVGGLDLNSTDESLRKHFEKFGDIAETKVMMDSNTQRSKRYGFVTYTNGEMVDNAQKARPHVVDGKEVQSKRVVPRQDKNKAERTVTSTKLFVGGLLDETDENDLRETFGAFGDIMSVNIISDKDTGLRRGFAFVEFNDYDPVDKIVLLKDHIVKGKQADVKKAISKQGATRGRGGYRGGRGGNGGMSQGINRRGRGGQRGNYNNGRGNQNNGNDSNAMNSQQENYDGQQQQNGNMGGNQNNWSNDQGTSQTSSGRGRRGYGRNNRGNRGRGRGNRGRGNAQQGASDGAGTSEGNNQQNQFGEGSQIQNGGDVAVPQQP